MFSRRLNWDVHPNPLTLLLDEKRAAGETILDLTESNPTLAALDYPADEILAALADPASLRYHPSPRGLLSAREAVAARFHASPDRILLTTSTSEAYAFLFKLLCDPGDEILTPRPSYPLFEFLAALESVHVRQYPLRYDGAWHVDFPALESSITSRTRAIVVVDPNNPTGSFLKPDEFDRLQSLHLPVIIDEVFREYSFTAPPPRPATRALTFRMSGLSKFAGLPQLKLGWILADGPGHAAAVDRLELIADTYLSVATPVQLALPRLLDASALIRDRILDRTRSNLASLRAATAASAIQPLNVEGGWYAILQVPRTRSEERWALDLLARSNVLVQPGFFFDFESEAFLVVSLLTESSKLSTGIHRLLTTDH